MKNECMDVLVVVYFFVYHVLILLRSCEVMNKLFLNEVLFSSLS